MKNLLHIDYILIQNLLIDIEPSILDISYDLNDKNLFLQFVVLYGFNIPLEIIQKLRIELNSYNVQYNTISITREKFNENTGDWLPRYYKWLSHLLFSKAEVSESYPINNSILFTKNTIDADNEIIIQACALKNALQRNINDNFISVSFDILKKKRIMIKFILKKITDVEKEYIDDILAEYSAVELDYHLKFEMVTDKIEPLKYLVYRVKT